MSEPAQRRSLLGRIALVFLSAAGSLLLLEGFSHVLLRLQPPAGFVDEWVFLSERPPPYEDADYFSHDFVVEAMHAYKRSRERGRLPDYHGDHINIVDGLRRTTDQPAPYDQTLHVFGASTTFSRRVPDELTFPSHLQRLLNARAGPRIRVMNHAYPGDLVHQQVARLKRAALKRGDIVAFYDGINEIKVGLYVHRHKDRLATGVDAGAVRRLNLVQRVMYDLRLRTGGRSAFVRLLFGLQRAEPVGVVEARGEMLGVLDRAAAGYLSAIVEANRFVEARGGRFHHFLQPTLYVQEARSEYEQWVVQNELKRLPGFDEAFRLGYPRLLEAHEAARKAGVSSFDATRAFDDRPAGKEIYFDTSHVNHVANQLIAERVYASIFGN